MAEEEVEEEDEVKEAAGIESLLSARRPPRPKDGKSDERDR